MAKATTHKHFRVLTQTLQPAVSGSLNVAAEVATYKDYFATQTNYSAEIATYKDCLWIIPEGRIPAEYVASGSFRVSLRFNCNLKK